MRKLFSPHITYAHDLWRAHLRPGDLAIDMTCGNGHDTALLCALGAGVIGFDIQPEAIAATRLRAGNQPTLHLRSHAEILQVPLPHPPRLIVFNLGYLPGGNKAVTTQTESTLDTLQKCLSILAPDGAISITCYPGHEEGLREMEAILQFVQTLTDWHVCHYQWVNRPRSPSLFWITS